LFELVLEILKWYLLIGSWVLGLATIIIFIRNDIMPWHAAEILVNIVLFDPSKLFRLLGLSLTLILTWPTAFLLIKFLFRAKEGSK
jgi:hypothetical protein